MATHQRPREKKVNPFHQRLGMLTYSQACQLLGDNGQELLRSMSSQTLARGAHIVLPFAAWSQASPNA